ncbi:MAG: exodeoxyribonuclease III [Candidatus Aureabacteria bacterium]|nr:exodeoxyribonuclease III [Candidatus Auribacterota bacterium]
MKIVSWNVNGLRAAAKKGYLGYLEWETPDVLCIQETKASPEQLEDTLRHPCGYNAIWNSSVRAGYAGVATMTKIKPRKVELGLNDPRFDDEGRVIMTEFDHFMLFNVYFPNGQKDEERLRFKLDFYDAFLVLCNRLRKQGKSIIVCGDYNTAHKEIDLTHPKANEKFSGFLPVERAWIDKWITNGYVDTFRCFNNKPGQYTWWSYRMNARAKNVGWRIDYHFVSEDLVPRIKQSVIHSHVMGSDHCPILLEIED